MFPEIDNAWEREQKDVVEAIKNDGRELHLGVDGQCDSPGHNATYCTVTAMDARSNKVVDLNVVNVKEVPNSQGIETHWQAIRKSPHETPSKKH